MPPAIELIYPTVNLLLYDLAEGLGQSEAERHQQQQAFWHRFYGREPDPTELNDPAQKKYTVLLKQRDYPLGSNLDGYYHPVKVHDSYVLRVDCSGEKSKTSKIDRQPVEVLKEIQQHILKSLQNTEATIGRSWVVLGILPPNADPKVTAQECCRVLTPNPDRTDLWGQGTLLGASLFESWHPDDDFHLLICLFPHQPTAEVEKPIQQLFPQLISLFLYRNKILWAYQQGQQLKTSLREVTERTQAIAQKLPQQVTQPSLHLQQLQKDLAQTLLNQMSYAENITALEVQGQTLQVNLGNYKERINGIAKLDPNSQLEFLQTFSTFAANKFQTQLESDFISLQAGSRLPENTIRSIEGIIALEQSKQNGEQSKRDRQLNQNVAIAGIGLATSQIAVAVILAQPPKPENSFLFRFQVFTTSLFVGLVFAGLLSLIFYGRRRKS